MTTADRHTDLDPATMDGHREPGHYADRDDPHRDDVSGYDTTQAAERHDVDAQDADARGVSDPTLTDAAATTPAEAGTEGSYASRHAEVPEQRTATGDGTPGTATTAPGEKLERLVPSERVQEYTTRWDAVKGDFVDEPRQAVAKADALVGELLDELDQLFRKQRSDLEHGLDADETSTEDLRLAMRRYRSFFDRLMAL